MGSFGENLRRLRKEKGLTQEQLAQQLGVSSVYIGTYEKDKRKPKVETIRRFAAALGCSALDLVDESTNSSTSNPVYSFAVNVKNMDDIKAVKNSPTIKRYKELSKLFSELSEEGQQKVIAYASDLAENPKYKK